MEKERRVGRREEFSVKLVSEGEQEVRLNGTYRIKTDSKYFEAMPVVVKMIN